MGKPQAMTRGRAGTGTPRVKSSVKSQIPKLSNGCCTPPTTAVVSDPSDDSSSSDEDAPSTYPPPTAIRPSGRVADWDRYLKLPDGLDRLDNIASVSLFKHAPLADIWDDLTKQPDLMTVEVPNVYIQSFYSETVHWFATIVHFAGYKCLLEYDNLDRQGHNTCYIEWASFCSDVIQPLGYSRKNRIPMLPPFEIESVPDFYERGLERSAGKLTVAENRKTVIAEAIGRKQIYPLGRLLEVVDLVTCDMSRMKLATVEGVVGDRICVKYVDAEARYFFNVKSEFVHPLGWSQTVEHDIEGVPPHVHFTPLDASYFPAYPEDVVVKRGQFLEVRHPVKTHKIVAAKVSKVLKHGYFIVVVVALVEPDDEGQWTVAFHLSSPYIFPCGFCKKHGIDLEPPFGEIPETFSWDKYFSKYNASAAPLHLLPKRPTPEFKLGMKLEAIDEADPSFLGPATIINIKEHLLWIHCDGWITGHHDGEDVVAEKWMDFESPNIYPVGFAELINHGFQGRVAIGPPTHPSIKYNALAESLGDGDDGEPENGNYAY